MEKRAKNLLIFSYVITISTQWCGIMYATPMSRAKYNEAQWAVLAHPTAVRQYFIGRSPRTSASEFSTAGYRIVTNKLPPASEAPAGASTASKTHPASEASAGSPYRHQQTSPCQRSARRAPNRRQPHPASEASAGSPYRHQQTQPCRKSARRGPNPKWREHI